jgi:hypothetical protein
MIDFSEIKNIGSFVKGGIAEHPTETAGIIGMAVLANLAGYKAVHTHPTPDHYERHYTPSAGSSHETYSDPNSKINLHRIGSKVIATATR